MTTIGFMTLDVIVRAKDGGFESVIGEVQVPLNVSLSGNDGTGFLEAVVEDVQAAVETDDEPDKPEGEFIG